MALEPARLDWREPPGAPPFAHPTHSGKLLMLPSHLQFSIFRFRAKFKRPVRERPSSDWRTHPRALKNGTDGQCKGEQQIPPAFAKA